MRPSFLTPLLVASAALLAHPDTVRPVRFGPYMVNHVTYTGNPYSYRYALNNVFYRFQVGWIEPISGEDGGIFKDAYFETDGNVNLSPYQSDVGTTFNVKPIRYIELGVSYNRLIFHNSMVTYVAPDQEMIDLSQARPGDLMELNREFGGADVFTFQANFTFDLGPTQLFVMGSRALWDVDVPGKDFLYEYSSDLVIKPRDRINTILGKWSLDLSRYSKSKAYSFTGLAVRNQYTFTTNTEQQKNLISAGITGFRLGRNPELHRRGLDFSLGYWTMHPQLVPDDWTKSVSLLMEWQWTVQILKL